ncbi:MAG TPA: translation initiation factor IF-2, partial [Cytophagaceae bacterium]
IEKSPEIKEAKKETPVQETKVEKEPVKEEVKAEEVQENVQEEEVEETSVEQEAEEETDLIEAKAEQLKGLTVLGKIELPDKKKKDKPVASSDELKDKKKAKRKRKRLRINTPIKGEEQKGQATSPTPAHKGGNKPPFKKGGKPAVEKKEEVSDKEIQDKIKATLAKLSGGGGKQQINRAKYRKEKRSAIAEANEERMLQEQEEAKTLRVTEFISANDMASLMGVSVNEVISTCLSLGMFVSINQRLDAEAITVIADEFGYNVQFTSAEEEEELLNEEEDNEEDLQTRAPIVTIMGHVDHGKTSLLDYIRKSKIAAGEAGGITQHIGAYGVTTDSGKKITFLDTPGHEAFTAMRARGAKVTDIVIIVVAADDSVMPQTKEAINHALVAGVPIVIAINKIDKPSANPDKIKEELAKENILVEDWGGKYQCELISAKTGQGVPELLEKVLLEAELLELKANPNRKAVGTVVEASLDKGRGYLATVLVQTGTLRVGDVMLAGAHYGKVKAMTDHRGNRLKEAGPSQPVQVLGLDGAPQAGDKFTVMDSEREAREIAAKREQLLREQSIRTKKHITLDEIGRRLAIGTFKELNVIVKGDVDGSVEALSDSLLKLSTDEVQVRIIHKAVGQISESDVLLASASDAVIVGFQVRPSNTARKLAEQEEIEIRLYSIIYDAINDVKDAMEGMLAPKVEEVITGNIEVREVFKISKVGTVAGCYVTDGTIKRNNNVRLIRDGIVVFTGQIDALKRFKDDVSEVKAGYECGVSLKGYNDIRIGDNIEGFEEKEVKRKL